MAEDKYLPEEDRSAYEELVNKMKAIAWDEVSLEPTHVEYEEEFPEAWNELIENQPEEHIEITSWEDTATRDQAIYEQWSQKTGLDPNARGYYTDEEWSSFYQTWCEETGNPYQEEASKPIFTYESQQARAHDEHIYELWREEHHTEAQAHFDALVAYYKGERNERPPDTLDIYTQWRQETGHLTTQEVYEQWRQETNRDNIHDFLGELYRDDDLLIDASLLKDVMNHDERDR